MKVYVDELPKKCEECYFCKNNHCLFDTADCPFDRNIITFDSLADYTKQVRKEVLDQVYKILTNESVWKELKSWWLRNGDCEELQNCLNAIVEGVAEEEIIKNFGSDRKFYMMLDQIQGE